MCGVHYRFADELRHLKKNLATTIDRARANVLIFVRRKIDILTIMEHFNEKYLPLFTVLHGCALQKKSAIRVMACDHLAVI